MDYSAGNAVVGAASGSVGDTVGDAVNEFGWDTVGDAVGESVGDAVGDSVGESVKIAFVDAVSGSVDDAVGDAVSESVGDVVGDSVVVCDAVSGPSVMPSALRVFLMRLHVSLTLQLHVLPRSYESPAPCVAGGVASRVVLNARPAHVRATPRVADLVAPRAAEVVLYFQRCPSPRCQRMP